MLRQVKSMNPLTEKYTKYIQIVVPRFFFCGKLCVLHRAVTFSGSIMKLELCQRRNLPKSISTEHPAPAILHRDPTNLKRIKQKIVFNLGKILASWTLLYI